MPARNRPPTHAVRCRRERGPIPNPARDHQEERIAWTSDEKYEKWCGLCHVTVFLMQVTQTVQQWPERSLRQRVWLGPASALHRIEDAGLADIVRQTLLQLEVALV